MPAPSPARGSAPTAPRCSRLSRMVSASSTILCDLRPLMSAMKPTPQESFSSAGSNRPKASTRPPFYPRPSSSYSRSSPPPGRHRSSGCDAIRPSAGLRCPAPRLLRTGEPFNLGGNLRAACLPPHAGHWLLVLAAVRRALVLAADLRAAAPESGGSRIAGHQLGQQCCPIQNMANSRLKYKRRYKRRAPKRDKKGTDRPDPPRIFPMSRVQVDHGTRTSAMAAPRREKISVVCSRPRRAPTGAGHVSVARRRYRTQAGAV